MSYGLAPPKNVTNLFGNWLKGIPKKILFKLEWVHALWSGQYGILGTILCLTNQKKKLFPAAYPHGYPLD
jgi:hypothetical protein